VKETILIKEYKPAYQAAINGMMKDIQSEFAEIITTKHSTVISQVYELPDQKYWVALCNEEVAGTVGIVLFGDDKAQVKRMMVHQKFRGREFQTATLLLNKALDWASDKKVRQIYLGTMKQFVAAQKFYEKSGFQKIDISELPDTYLVNPMDTIFYTKEL
jgi:N-acetylglutamate synthase-like GNAT family acetyltransferase